MTIKRSGIIVALCADVGFGALLGPVLAGVVFDLWESYAILFSIVAPVIAAVSVLSAQAPERWRYR